MSNLLITGKRMETTTVKTKQFLLFLFGWFCFVVVLLCFRDRVLCVLELGDLPVSASQVIKGVYYYCLPQGNY